MRRVFLGGCSGEGFLGGCFGEGVLGLFVGQAVPGRVFLGVVPGGGTVLGRVFWLVPRAGRFRESVLRGCAWGGCLQESFWGCFREGVSGLVPRGAALGRDIWEPFPGLGAVLGKSFGSCSLGGLVLGMVLGRVFWGTVPGGRVFSGLFLGAAVLRLFLCGGGCFREGISRLVFGRCFGAAGARVPEGAGGGGGRSRRRVPVPPAPGAGPGRGRSPGRAPRRLGGAGAGGTRGGTCGGRGRERSGQPGGGGARGSAKTRGGTTVGVAGPGRDAGTGAGQG